jgi:hypothetical protein
MKNTTEKNKSVNNITGVSGEYFVAAELSQRGIVASITLKNTPYIDILATNLKTGRSVNIQVKTMSLNNNTGWRLGPKDQEPSGILNHFYVLVDLRGPGMLPDYIILPKKVLANFLKADHENWLSGKKRDGSNRKDTDIRVFNPNKNIESKKIAIKYKNNWEILKLW